MNVLQLLSRLKESDIFIEVVDNRLKINAPEGTLTPDFLYEIKKRKQDILDFLQKKVQSQVDYASINPAEEKEYYSLSSAQKRLYFLQQLDLESSVYNISMAVPIPQHADIKKVETICHRLIHRHDSLRTSFGILEGKVYQKIHPGVDFKIESYSGFDDLSRSFDLSRAPLLRAGIINLATGGRLLVVNMHHIITDGVSGRILIKDFLALYRGEHFSPLRLQYKDYAEWYNRVIQQDAFKKQSSFWVKIFSEEIPVLNLPTDYPRPPFQLFEGNQVYFTIPEKETAILKEKALEKKFTLYMLLFSILSILMSKLSGQEDIVIGTPIAGRSHADLGNIIGMFVNTLAIRSYPSGEKTFDAFGHEVRQLVLEVFENQNYPFEDLVDTVVKKRDTARNPLFDVMFSFQTFEDTQQTSSTEKTDEQRLRLKVSRFDMSWQGVDLGKRISFSIEYSTHLFKKDTILLYIKYFMKIISTILEDFYTKIWEIEIIADDDKKKILIDFNNTATPYPADISFHRLFEKQVEKTPHHIALEGASVAEALGDDTVKMSYQQLNQKAAQLAVILRARGLVREGVVGIMCECSIEMVVAMMAAFKAGGAFLLIDPDYPLERKEYMLKDSCLKFLGLSPEIRGKFEAMSSDNDGNRPSLPFHCFDLNEGVSSSTADSLESFHTPPRVSGKNLAYVIYTSGSTGKPKGTLIEHHSLNNLCHWHNECYSIVPADRATHYAGISFDATIWEIFPYLIAGASIYIVDKKVRLDIRLLNNCFEKNQVTVSFLPTQICEEFNTMPNHSLRILLTGGDKLNSYTKRDYQLVNNYGPTENTVVSTYFYVNAEYPNIPIGKPIFNTKLYILDISQRLLPFGIPGELCISGVGLGRGYLNNPELTADKFKTNSRWGKIDNRVYYTGDLAKWLLDGNIEFLGRIDAQVKIRGQRIELGEIEHHLLKHENIKEAVVLAKEQKGNKVLCAYIVPLKEFNIQSLKGYLASKLPDYMVPLYFMSMEKLPLTSAGKVNHKELPKPEITTLGKYTPPRNEREARLCKLWSDVLGMEKEKISVDDNFFEIGGNSLNLITLVGKIEKEFGLPIPISHIYLNATIEQIAKALLSKDFFDSSVILLNLSGRKKIFCFPNQAGYGYSYRDLALALNDYSLYAFEFIEEEDRLNRYIEKMNEIQPHGAFVFFGHSAAGRLSFEMAKALENNGREVSDIIFADCFFYADGLRDLEGQTVRLRRRVLAFLDEWNAGFFKEQVMKKMENHMVYLCSVPKLDIINANIHLILSEEVRQRDDVNLRCWENMTHKSFRTYNGWGTHLSMMLGSDLEKNVKIMREILERVPFEEA
jgi:amino acid adenylation domain-containing protein